MQPRPTRSVALSSLGRRRTRDARANDLTYVRSAIVSRPALSASVFAVCLGLGYAGSPAPPSPWSRSSCSVRCPRDTGSSQRHLRPPGRSSDARARETARLGALRPSACAPDPVPRAAHPGRADRATDPVEPSGFELQELPRALRAPADGHRRCFDALRIAGSNDPRSLSRSRRLEGRSVAARSRRDESASRRVPVPPGAPRGRAPRPVDELVRLLAQRTACPVAARAPSERSSVAVGARRRSTQR